MKIRRPISIILAIIIALSAISMTSVAALGVSNGWFTKEWNNKSGETQDNNVVKYEKPDIGDIAGDGAYPDEIKSSASDSAKEKQWYEYINYSREPIEVDIFSDVVRARVYDPYDYSYGMVMEVSDVVNKSSLGESISYSGWSSANSMDFSYTTGNSTDWSNNASVELGFEEELETSVKALFIDNKLKLKFSQSLGYSHSWGGSVSESQTVSMTYQAVYFNNKGVPRQWTVVAYTVYLPVLIKIDLKVNGEWVQYAESYCLLKTIEGTCRAFIDNGTPYYEHWATGEAVTWENFWQGFFTPTGIIEAYTKKLSPSN